MTEYNLFCYSKNYNDENSFQQKRWRVFNKEVGETSYKELLQKCEDILGTNLRKLLLTDFWKQVTQEQWNKLMNLAKEVRGDDFKEGFEYISNLKIGEPNIEIAGTTVEIFKDKIKVGCTEVTLDTISKIIDEMKKCP